MTVPTLKHTSQGCLWMHMVTEIIHFSIFATFHCHIITNIHCHRITNDLCLFYVPYHNVVTPISHNHTKYKEQIWSPNRTNMWIFSPTNLTMSAQLWSWHVHWIPFPIYFFNFLNTSVNYANLFLETLKC